MTEFKAIKIKKITIATMQFALRDASFYDLQNAIAIGSIKLSFSFPRAASEILRTSILNLYKACTFKYSNSFLWWWIFEKCDPVTYKMHRLILSSEKRWKSPVECYRGTWQRYSSLSWHQNRHGIDWTRIGFINKRRNLTLHDFWSVV